MKWTTAAGWFVAAVVLLLSLGGPAAGVPQHDHPSPTPTPTTGEHAGHAGHEAPPAVTTPSDPPVSDSTRAAVLGGFGAANAAVIGTAFALKRRDRRTGRVHRPRSVRR